MSRNPRVTGDGLIAALERVGFRVLRVKGSHHFLRHEDGKGWPASRRRYPRYYVKPPTPPRRAHQFIESRQERLARWRADTMVAATALATDMLLIHNNAAGFEMIRGSIEQNPVRFPGLGPLRLIRCASVL